MSESERNDPRDRALGDEVKAHEGVEARRRLPDHLPVMIRLDGRAFHTFTRGCDRPFDLKLRGLMVAVTQVMVEETNAVLGYTQSDEISLCLRGNDPDGAQVFCGGRIQKITSLLAARVSVAFNHLLPQYLPHKKGGVPKTLPVFDCRVWSVPTEEDACKVFEWRDLDARVNSLEMVARAHFSHRELDGKGGPEMREMLLAKGVDYYGFPRNLRRGTYLQRRSVARPFSAQEVESLPPKHEARTNPDFVVMRRTIVEVDMPPYQHLTNVADVVFRGAEPVTHAQGE